MDLTYIFYNNFQQNSSSNPLIPFSDKLAIVKLLKAKKHSSLICVHKFLNICRNICISHARFKYNNVRKYVLHVSITEI